MKKLLVLSALVLSTSLGAAYAADAEANYKQLCAKCHGEDGKGDTKMGKKLGIKDYTDAKVQEKFTDDQAFKALKEGMKEKDTDKVLMKPVENLNDQELKDLVAYMRKMKK